jgi:drug/metabolite transporter (DMT)-like permease
VTRQLTTDVLFVVLAAGVLHAVWNAIAKAITDRLVGFAAMGAASFVVGAGVLAVRGWPRSAALWFVIASAIIHIGYELALMRAYKLGAFNQMYPVARGTSPLLVTVGGLVFASERLSGLALAGVCVLAVGLMSLSLSSRLDRSELPALGWAVATGVTIAAYTIVDGLGARRSGDPIAYAALLFVLQGPVFIIFLAARDRSLQWMATAAARRGMLAGVLSVIAYAAVIWAQTKAPLGEVSALRETGVISGALIGTWFFKESFGYRRLIAAALVAAGIVLIGV